MFLYEQAHANLIQRKVKKLMFNLKVQPQMMLNSQFQITS